MLYFTNDIRNQRVLFSKKKFEMKYRTEMKMLTIKTLVKLLIVFQIHFSIHQMSIYVEQYEPNLRSSSLLI